MSIRNWKGIHFLRLQGTELERTLAHGRAARPHASSLALHALSQMNPSMILNSSEFEGRPRLARIAASFYRRVLIPMLVSQAPDQERQAISLMAKETGIPKRTLQESLFQADGLMLLSRISMTRHLLPEYPGGALPACTSLISLPQYSADGKLRHARNQDYPVVGPWEKHTALLFHEPSESGRIPHVSVTSLGVHTSGLTAMNREGITVAAHAHFGARVRLKGVPVFTLGSEIIQRAKSLGEAVDIARKLNRVANWALVLSSAKEKTGIVLELSPDQVSVREPLEDGRLAHSNFFHNRDFQKHEALASCGCIDDFSARYQSALQLLKDKKGEITVRDLANFLASHQDVLTNQERVFGNIVSTVVTLKSVIFEPESQSLWIANRGQTPQALGEFVRVPVDSFWNNVQDPAQLEVLPAPERPAALIEAVALFRKAYQAFHGPWGVSGGDAPPPRSQSLQEAIHWVGRARDRYPTDAHLEIMLGFLCFKAHQWDPARQAFERALDLPLHFHSRAVAQLFLARDQDLRGNRDQALRGYQNGLSNTALSPQLSAAYSAGSQRPYRSRDTRSMDINLQFPDLFHY